jgi:hypothetical protein
MSATAQTTAATEGMAWSAGTRGWVEHRAGFAAPLARRWRGRL